MDNHNEFYTNLDSKLNDFMYNSQFEFIHLYAYLYKYCTTIQQKKYKDCRNELITFYKDVFEHINVILYNYNLDIFETLINSENKLKLFVNKYNTYKDNLKWLNKLTQYINNELKKLDSTYEKLDYTKYGLEVWYKNVTLNISKFINSKLTYYLDYENYELTESDNENIFYLNELIDTIYFAVNNKVIDQTQFDTIIGNSIYDFIDSNIIKLSGFLQHLYSNNYLHLIDKYYYFYEKILNDLNLNYLQFRTRNLYKTYILDKFTNSFKETIYTTLIQINFENIDNQQLFGKLRLSIRYIQDYKCFKIIFNNWLNDDYNSKIDYDKKIEGFYLYNLIYNKLLKIIPTEKIKIISIVLDELYLNELKNEKSCIELFDKYIRTILYKNEKYLYYFTNLLVYYFEKYRSEEIVFEYYKNYLVRRLYKYNFNSALIKIEITILNELFKYLKTINLHKLNIIKNDINDSKEITKEFNEIYNLGDKIYITTTGIWDISPNEHHLVNEIFKHQYTLFTNQFKSYYNCKYDKRTLKWSDTMTNCILDFNINNKIYHIECPIKYADILYYFNDRDIIDDSIALENNDTLELLCQYKLIKKKKNNIFTINTTFNYKKSHFTIKGSQTKKIKKKQDSNEIFTKKELLELYIVRTLKHDNLEYDTLLNAIKDKFEVSSKFISEILNNLVDKGYLSNENNNYLYVI